MVQLFATRGFTEILADKQVQERMAGSGAFAHFEDPAAFGARIRQDYTKWGQLIREKGIAAE